ncbi:MAG: chalcone isomerase family protein [Rhodoferax sp.]|nr:chalcone isomerase family protein [Rhodoferax sp.]
MKKLMTAIVAALSLNIAFAGELEGVKYDDKVKVGGVDLVANGAGVRSKFGKRYVAVLYLAATSNNASAILSSKGPKRVVLNLLKDGDGKTFAKAFAGGMEDNSTEAEMAALKDRVKTFKDIMISMGEASAGSKVMVEWIPEKGTVVTVNGAQKGKEIPGEDFFKAVLKIWLGEDPVQDDLKAALLGKS